ncbi:hypothetical protein evm_008690 [Chilo suppressalis]|nr:hypothetical protein evm_008690 [Chilo suppressalis]
MDENREIGHDPPHGPVRIEKIFGHPSNDRPLRKLLNFNDRSERAKHPRHRAPPRPLGQVNLSMVLVVLLGNSYRSGYKPRVLAAAASVHRAVYAPTSCNKCPTNLCKSIALAQFCASRDYSRIVTLGTEGMTIARQTNLPANGVVFPRRGYPLHDLIKKTLASPNPQVKAKVVPWEHCDAILQEIFPDEKIIATLNIKQA